MKTKTFLLLCGVITAVSYIHGELPRLNAGDSSDERSEESAYIYGSPYTVESLKKAKSSIDQSISWSAAVEETQRAMQTRLDKKTDDKAVHKVKPELKRKSSSSKTVKGKQIAESTMTPVVGSGIVDSLHFNVNMGSGADQRDTSGVLVSESGKKMVSEIIDGVRYVYAGFDNDRVENISINRAMELANSGDKVILKGGQYYAYADGQYHIEGFQQSKVPYYVRLNIKDGVSLYGGYNNAGIRDLTGTPTVIKGQIAVADNSNPVEINGVKVDALSPMSGSQYGANAFSSWRSKNVVVVNSTFMGCYAASIGTNGHVSFYNNTFIGGELAYLMAVTNAGTSVLSYNNNFIGKYGVAVFDQGSFSSNHDYYNISADNSAYKNPVWGGASTKIADESLISNMPAERYDTKLPTSKIVSFKETITYKDIAVRAYDLSNQRVNKLDTGSIYRTGSINTAPSGPTLGSVFKAFLAKGLLLQGMAEKAYYEAFANTMRDALNRSALPAHIAQYINTNDAQIIARLANILSNPTEDQKVMLTAVESILNSVEDVKNEADNPELAKAEDEFVQAVSAVFLAQAIPELMKERDIEHLKDIFSEMNASKDDLLLKYREAVKPYYDHIKAEIIKSLGAMQAKKIIADELTKEAVLKLSQKEIDAIIERVKSDGDRSYEENAMLEWEAKYRADYLTANQKALAIKMKIVINRLTNRLYDMLYVSGAMKETK